jgi:hypothetical protein
VLSALEMDFTTFMGVEADTAGTTSSAVTLSGEQAAAPVKEVVKEVPVEVIREVVKEVPVEVIKEVVKEVPASAPAGKSAIYIDEKLYAQIQELAKDEGITDPDTITRILEEYLEAGFGYHQRPLRSMLRDAKPHSGRGRGDMDSFLL